MAPEPAQTATTRNPARQLERAGMAVAIGLLVPAALRGCLHGTASLTSAAIFGGAGLLALLCTVWAWHRFLLRGRLHAEIMRGNLAAGVASAAHIVSSGVIVSSCFTGDDPALLHVSLGFFLIAQASLLVMVLLFRTLTRYADDQEIAGENLAAALSYAGVTLALAVIVGHAADGTFTGWLPGLRAYGLSLLLALVLYPVRQVVVSWLLLRFPLALVGGGLDRAIAQERDTHASLVEAVGYLAAALLVTGLA